MFPPQPDKKIFTQSLTINAVGEILGMPIPEPNTVENNKVENSSAFLNDISASAFLVNVDYFTSPVTLDEFNKVRQRVNLEILGLMEKLGVTVSGASTDIRLTSNEAIRPGPSAQGEKP